MSLIIILLALLIERFAVFVHRWRAHHWFERYASKMNIAVGKQAYVSLPASLLPILIIIYFVNYYLEKLSFGWPAWIFGLVVLVYCLGNTHLRARAQECYEQIELGNIESARALLFENFDVAEEGDITVSVLMKAFYRASLQRVFSILFWFVVLGPMGAVLYRLMHKLSIYSLDETMKKVTSLAHRIAFLLDWIPARLLALSFCLAGNFMDVFSEWRGTFKAKMHETYQVLYHCGHAAIRAEENPEPTAVSAQLDDAYHLICRSLFIWLVALALILLF